MFDHGVIASAFHMEQGGGGVYSIFNPAILRNVNLYTGGFGAEYGDRLSAVLDAETRDGSTERVTGSVAISTAFGEGVIEGPLPGTEGKGSFLISARRSYFDLLVSLTEYKESFVVFPNYYDLAAKFNYQLSPRHTLILTSLWASDNAIFKLRENESDIPGNVDMYSEKSLVSMKLESTLGRSLISRLVLSTSRAKYYEHTEDLWKNDQLKQVYTLREDILWDASTYHRIGVGVILDQRLHDIAMKMPNVFDFQERLRQEMPLEQLDASLSSPFFGTYVTDAWKTSSWLTLEVGIRTDYLNRTGEWTWSPRVAAAMKVTDNLTCKTAWGLYYQTPPLQETAEGYGNPHLRSRRAQHLILGLESTLPLDLTARVETYYKSFERLPMNDSLIGFNDRGKGYSYGAGVFVQRRFTSDLNGWASYSYTVARRSEYKYPISVPPDFDMPHHATIVATYDFAQNWQLGIRWHFTSGKPTNPIIGAILDSTSGSYKPIYGEPNSEHLPDYHLLDLRLLKKFHFSSWNLTVFLEVMNAYNRLNIAEYKWNSTYTERQAMTYFGIIPSIGIIAQF
jgi:outer membrane receptor protein involved in Fe transport